jgi:shikimate kinase
VKRIVITGPKSSGKSNIGERFAKLQSLPFFDLDTVLEEVFEEEDGSHLSFREIFRRHGEERFRDLELKAAKRVSQKKGIILSTGGTTFTIDALKDVLVDDAYIILLTNSADILWQRTARKGIPAYLSGESDPQAAFARRVDAVIETVKPFADMVLDTTDLSIEDVSQLLDVEMLQRKISFKNG